MFARACQTIPILLIASCAGTNHPPLVAPIGPLTVTVGETLVKNLSASDPDGDEVRFEVHGAPDGAKIEDLPGSAGRFVYSPLASDAGPGGRQYDLSFVASDGRGGRTTVHAALDVVPEGSEPAFKGPFAWTVNLAETDHIAAMIKVRDDDTASLAFRMIIPLEGAVFEQVDGHTASLYWRPKPAQVAAGPVFTFQVGVKDPDHPETVADFVIVLINAGLFGGCPGSPPKVSHQAPGEAWGMADYAVQVDAADAESAIREVSGAWSVDPEATAPEWNAIQMTSGDGRTFSGVIPNLSAAAGDGRLVFFHFLVTDDDDHASDFCDHQTRLPKSGELALAFYGPDQPVSCLEDGIAQGHDIGSASALPGGVTKGLRLCGGLPDVFRLALFSGQSVAAVVRPMSGKGQATLAVLDAGGGEIAGGQARVAVTAMVDGILYLRVTPPDTGPMTYELSAATFDDPCPADSREPDDSTALAKPLPAGKIEGRICPADIDRATLHLDPGEAAEISLTFDPLAADLDIFVDEQAGGPPVALSAGLTGCETLVVEAAAARDLVVTVVATGTGSADYVLDTRVEGQGALCADDMFAPSSSPAEAPLLPEFTWDKLRLCPGTLDHFRLDLNGGEDLLAQIQPSEGEPAPPLAILGHDGVSILASSKGGGSSNLVETTVPGPGAVYFRVGPGPDHGVGYSLAFGAKDPPGPCQPDRLEPNDDASSPTGLADGFTTHLTLCQGDSDVFAFKMGAVEAIEAVLLFGSSAGHMRLQDAGGKTLGEGAPDALGEAVSFVAPEKGSYFLVVQGAGGNTGWYDIWLKRE